MTTFTEALIQIVPDIRTGTVADVRSSLIGLARQLQQDPDSQAHSLQTWWQWLDDEGYDRETFATILAQICKIRIGEQGLFELTSFITSSKDNADGIAILLEQVKQSHPSLLEEVETLESLALEEENQLGATAGGLSKGGKIGTAVGVVGVASLVGGGIYLARARRNRPGGINQAIRQGGDRVIENVERDVRNEINEGVAQVAEHPQKVIENLKSNEFQPREQSAIKDFNAGEINDKAEHYAMAHGKKLVRAEVEKSYLNDETRLDNAMEEYFKVNEGGVEKRLRETGVRFDHELRDGKLADIKKFKGTQEYEDEVSKWGKGPWGQDAEREASKVYIESLDSTIKAYKALIVIEKSYKENMKLHEISKGISELEGFANTDVNEAIKEMDRFGTKLSIDVEKRAKEAVQEYEKAVDEFAKQEEREAREFEEQSARFAEQRAKELESGARSDLTDAIDDIEIF